MLSNDPAQPKRNIDERLDALTMDMEILTLDVEPSAPMGNASMLA